MSAAFEVAGGNFTAFIEPYVYPPTPTAEEVLRGYSNAIQSALNDGGFQIEWKGPPNDQ